jgi:hypothetical protein
MVFRRLELQNPRLSFPVIISSEQTCKPFFDETDTQLI